MNAKLFGAVLVVVALLASGAGTAYGCCGKKDMPADGSGNAFAMPAAVGWAASVDEALKSAKTKGKPIAIYFATKEEFKVIGESPDAIKQFAADNGNSLPSTIFDLPKIITQLRGMGVTEFVKIAHTKENREVAGKYEAGPNFVVLVSPNGERLEGGSIARGGVDKLLASAKTKLEAWQTAQTK